MSAAQQALVRAGPVGQGSLEVAEVLLGDKDRLLLVLQLAACFVLAQGCSVLRRGLRHVLERPDRRTLSLFALGLRWLDRARLHFVPLCPHLSLHFP